MIDPNNLPDVWGDAELEEFALFSIAVAGHSANTTAKTLNSFLLSIGWPSKHSTPFKAIRYFQHWNPLRTRRMYLEYKIEDAGMGCYSARSESFMQIAHSNINLRTAQPFQLERIYGIGPKTSRFFIMYTRPDEADRYAVLDRHILRWMARELDVPTPQNTPTSTHRYAELEKIFLKAARDRELSARALDTLIWQYRLDKEPRDRSRAR